MKSGRSFSSHVKLTTRYDLVLLKEGLLFFPLDLPGSLNSLQFLHWDSHEKRLILVPATPFPDRVSDNPNP